ncbi:cationic amino acid transporter 3-like isoform X4 [Phacochoerus africanus]|uniref:cationic amino acid transporter 3-like isoform X4 n=1 Tax=Phacochoerus africanus TaxID=41426 RepID=UPI001FDA9DA2|nr:cationic amino acid transporter 3-like isoform X4 [Phacochoerus africanus]
MTCSKAQGGASSTIFVMLGQRVRQFGEKLVRRRPLEPRNESEIPTPHLNTFDLVVFGVNRTLRAGVYILAGAVAVYVAGPAIIISFLVAGLFALLSGFYFAEFGARVPCCGSVYLYSYVTMGQLYAFITGWNIILHFVLATAYLTRAWSYTFDSLIGNHISQKLEGTFSEHMPSFLAPYPDFVALALVLLMAGLLILGVHVTARVTKVSTGINALVLSFIIISGFIKGDLHNWQLTEQDYKLAASDSYRERNPQPSAFHPLEHRDLHLHLLFGLLWCLSSSHPHGALLPDSSLQPLAAVVSPCWLGSCRILCGCCHPVCSFLQPPGCHVDHVSVDLCNGRGWAPFPGTWQNLCPKRHPHRGHPGFCNSFRYQPDQSFSKEKVEEEIEMEPIVEGNPSPSVPEAGTSNPLKSLCNPISTTPTLKSGQIVYGCAFLLVLLLTILSLLLALWPSHVFSGDPGFTAGAVLLLLLIVGITAIIWRQPQNPSPLHFRVLSLPVFPLISIFVNIYLIIQMTTGTWAQFGIWNAVGFAIYFGYGIRHSLEEKSDQNPPASNFHTFDEHTSSAKYC